jgi:hypothetical protein
MPAPVPRDRPAVPAGGISFGRPVRSFDWMGLATLANYARGRGSVIVPQSLVMETIAKGVITRTYRVRLKNNSHCMQRMWLLELLGATASAVCTVSVSINGGTAVSYTCTNSNQLLVPAEFLETATPSSSETEHTVAVTTNAAADCTVVSIAAVEMPRASLDISNEQGIDLGREAPLQPIDVNSLGNAAGQACGFSATDGALNHSRRVGMHHCILGGSEGNGFQFTGSTAFQAIYTTDCEAPMLGRYLYSGDTTRTLTFKAYGKISGGATLSVKLTMTSGATTTITTTSATGVWFGSSNTIAVDAEDLTATDGRRSSRFDLAKIEASTSNAGQTLTLYTVSVWEDTQ